MGQDVGEMIIYDPMWQPRYWDVEWLRHYQHEFSSISRALETSQLEDVSVTDEGEPAIAAKDMHEDDNGVDAKKTRLLGVQLWTRVYTTTSVTMLFTDTGTTVSLSYFCPGWIVQLPLPCNITLK